jgi:dTDP-4-dehydrorhamnose reductase
MAIGRRLLILGGSGFLGAHVAVEAARSGSHDVVIASREPTLPAGAKDAPVGKRTFDALIPGSLAQLLDDVRPHSVVVCTALPTVDACERYPVLARTLNADLPAGVARWTSARRQSGHDAHLVLVSTDLVFGSAPPRRERYAEDDPPSPASEYGRTKVAGETATLRADPTAVVARTALLYGNSFGRGLGASDSILAAVARGEQPPLFTDEWRTPLDVRTAARALIRLADSEASGLVHVAGRERLSRYELGLRVLGGKADRVRAATRAAEGLASRPPDVSLDTNRARTILGEGWDAS